MIGSWAAMVLIGCSVMPDKTGSRAMPEAIG